MYIKAVQLAALGLSLLSPIASIALLGLSAYLIAAASLQPELYLLALPITGVRACGLLRALLRYGERYMGHEAAFALSAGVSRRLFLYLLQVLPFRRSNGESQGSFLHRLNRSAEEWRSFYLRGVTPMLVSLLLALLAGAALHGLGSFSPLFAWLPLWCWLAVAGIACLGEMRQRGLAAEYGAYRRRLLDFQSGREELLAFGGDAWAAAQLDRAAEKLWQADRRQGRCRSLTGLAVRLVLALSFCLLMGEVWQGCPPGGRGFVEAAVLAVSLQALLGELAGLEEAVRHVLQSLSDTNISQISENNSQFEKNSSQGREESTIIKNSPINSNKVGLKADRLSFSYDGTHKVLGALSFEIREGEKAAVLGDSGSGKTTLFYLLLGLWQPDSGTLQGSLLAGGSMVSAITQDVYVFDADMGELFRRLCPEASGEDVWRALELAQLAGFVRKQPEGLGYRLGQDGCRLSGGQRQRLLTALAAARALSTGSRLIMLDEPSCGLDRQAAERMLAGLLAVFADRTMLVITHDEYVADLFQKKILL